MLGQSLAVLSADYFIGIRLLIGLNCRAISASSRGVMHRSPAARHAGGNVIGKRAVVTLSNGIQKRILFDPFCALTLTFSVVRRVPDGLDDVCLRLDGWVGVEPA